LAVVIRCRESEICVMKIYIFLIFENVKYFRKEFTCKVFVIPKRQIQIQLQLRKKRICIFSNANTNVFDPIILYILLQ